MYNLLYKEFRLAAHPTLFIFMFMGALLLIPAYPYCTVFLYGCLAPFITFSNARENQDAFYTALLPVKKSDIVKAKCVLVSIAQLGQLLLSLPFAFLRSYTVPQGNPVGMEANMAYYGFGLIIYAVFHFIFFTSFYKTAYKVGRAFVFAMIPASLCMIVMEILPHIPSLTWLDGTSLSVQLRQIPILGMGLLLYLLAVVLSYYAAAKRFEQVDL